MNSDGTSTDTQRRQRLLANLFGGDIQRAQQLRLALPNDQPDDWRAVAAQLAVALPVAHSKPLVVGICGGQGAGKSTLAQTLVQALDLIGVRAATVSLDDFYLTRARRQELARKVHPLLATRGVPGTHDLALIEETFASLNSQQIRLPRFNKAMDDREAEANWQTLWGPLDVLVFEGWCVGAMPQPNGALKHPVNTLEAEEDADGRYRHFVNQALASDYARLWQQLYRWLYLAVPDMAAVARWRGQQEQQLTSAAQMAPAALARFIAHYERLTLWQAETAPEQADWCLKLDADHRLAL